MHFWSHSKPSFGFVSTRLAGTDGVSLEAEKWVQVLRGKGCKVFYMAGQLDTEPECSMLAPRAFFKHPEIVEVQDQLFGKKQRDRPLTQRIHELKEKLRDDLHRFHERFGFDVLVIQNASAIPVNVPLGVALAEFIAETQIPTIAHHHDFYWERQRFHSMAAMDYLRAAFPPVHPAIRHVVISAYAGSALARRTGVDWTVVPNVMDFKVMPAGVGDYNRDLRAQIGLSEDSLLVLQPTRLVSRKGIETSIELVSRLGRDSVALVVPHEAGDEGPQYLDRVRDYAEFLGVDLRLIADRIGKTRGQDDRGRKRYTLADVYPHADLVSYPSIYEGYGNAFVEAVYFRKPVLVNRYLIYETDIEPKGFRSISFEGFITRDTVSQVNRVLDDAALREEMIEHNYMLGWRYLSYELLEEKLEAILTEIYGS